MWNEKGKKKRGERRKKKEGRGRRTKRSVEADGDQGGSVEGVKSTFDQGGWFGPVTKIYKRKKRKRNHRTKQNSSYRNKPDLKRTSTKTKRELHWLRNLWEIKSTTSKPGWIGVCVNDVGALETSDWLDHCVQPPTAAECPLCQVVAGCLGLSAPLMDDKLTHLRRAALN